MISKEENSIAFSDPNTSDTFLLYEILDQSPVFCTSKSQISVLFSCVFLKLTVSWSKFYWNGFSYFIGSVVK